MPAAPPPRLDALELASIAAAWPTEGFGVPPMVRTLARRRDEGATLEELALAIDALRGESLDGLYLRRAFSPAGAIFASLESVRRFAHHGRAVREKRERERARVAAEREARKAENVGPSPEVAGADRTRGPAELAAEVAKLPPLRAVPAAQMTLGEQARRRAEQLETLNALISGELVEIPIKGDVR